MFTITYTSFLEYIKINLTLFDESFNAFSISYKLLPHSHQRHKILVKNE